MKIPKPYTSNSKKPCVSIIIPVFNDSKRLKRCLEALERQTYPKDLYEIIVVDNNSDENTKEIVDQFTQAIITHESKQSSYAARNKGISLAKNEIIAFTDSDCVPASDWIEKGVFNLLKTPKCGLVAGKIQIFYQNPDQPTAVELYEKVTAFPQKKYVEELNFGATANIFTFKSVIVAVGSFDERLKSSGDYEWGRRVFANGYDQIYAEDTIVEHPARYSFEELNKKIARIIKGKQNLKAQKNGFSLFLKSLFWDLISTCKKIYNIIKNPPFKQLKLNLKVIWVILFVYKAKTLKRIRQQFRKNSIKQSQLTIN